MPKGELFINKNEAGVWNDAYEKWGLSMTDKGLSALMTPAGNKEYIIDDCRLDDGKRYILGNERVDARTVTLPCHITARNKEEFFRKYNEFCEILKGGELNIKTKYQEGIVYKCVYISCTQFTQFRQEMAHFSLKLVEQNPNDRSE